MDDNSQFSKVYEKQMAVSVMSRLNEQRFEHMRGMSIGGASLATALVFLIFQTPLNSVLLETALILSVVAIPLWIATWQIVEAYVFCGPASYGHFSTVRGSLVAVVLFLLAALFVFVGMTLLLLSISVVAAVIFVPACLLMVVFVYRHHNAVRAFADKQSRPGA